MNTDMLQAHSCSIFVLFITDNKIIIIIAAAVVVILRRLLLLLLLIIIIIIFKILKHSPKIIIIYDRLSNRR